MALAVDSVESGGTAHRILSDTGPLTYAFTNTAGDLLVVGVIVTCSSGGTSVITGVTYGGQALTALGTGQLSGTLATITQWFYKIAPLTGANNVSVSYTTAGSSSGACLAGAISFSGAHQTVPLGSEVKASGTSATPATGSMTNTSGNYLIAVASHGDGHALTDTNGTSTQSFAVAGSGNTSGDNIGGAYWPATGTGHDMQFDFTNSDTFGIVGVEVKAAAAGNSSSVSPSVSSSSSASLSPSRSPSPSSSVSASPSQTPSSSPSPSPAGIIVMERTVFYYVD